MTKNDKYKNKNKINNRYRPSSETTPSTLVPQPFFKSILCGSNTRPKLGRRF